MIFILTFGLFLGLSESIPTNSVCQAQFEIIVKMEKEPFPVLFDFNSSKKHNITLQSKLRSGMGQA